MKYLLVSKLTSFTKAHAQTCTPCFGHVPSFPTCVNLEFADMLMAPIFDLGGFWKQLSLLCANTSRGRSVAVNNLYRKWRRWVPGSLRLKTSTSITCGLPDAAMLLVLWLQILSVKASTTMLYRFLIFQPLFFLGQVFVSVLFRRGQQGLLNGLSKEQAARV